MIALFGQLSLILALLFSLCQGVLPLLGYRYQNYYLLVCARPTAFGQCFFIVLAYALMTLAFYLNDFSIAYVANNSHASLPLMYRLTAVWGAHEGSILLWVVILNIWTLLYAALRQPLAKAWKAAAPDSSRQACQEQLCLTLSVLGLISFCFLCFLMFTSNPFLTTTDILPGRDLNPLLQDPGFVIHPPMLYAGYVGFSVVFAITQAALIRTQLDLAWAQITRKFALAAWCFLTLGITLGSWWSYRVLGWGGYWFWDPVENASLLPWLSGTALIHVLVLADKRDTAKNWAALLALISFALSLLGTFLVRSGLLISAHTFANDPARGIFLLLLLAVLVSAALSVYIVKLPSINSPANTSALVSRETSLLVNSGLLSVAMLTILLGTLYPLILDALHLGAISVGAPYFNAVMAPLIFIMMIFMGLGPLCAWQQQAGVLLFRAVWKKILIGFISACVILWCVTEQFDFYALVSLSLSFWIIISVANALRFLPGMTLAHAGFAILVIGVMLSSVLSIERDVRVKPGDVFDLGPYQFLFLDTQGVKGANYRGVMTAFDVTKNHRHITNLYPEKRIYTVREMVMTKVDIHPSLFRDLYLALGEPLDNNTWSVRAYYKPFIRWIWFGGAIMILGGLISLGNRREKAI